jgi:hypothetical protein
MFLKNSRVRVLGSLALIAALGSVSFADTVRLKDGSIIKGKIVSFGGGKFKVAVGDGARRRELTYSAGEVESIAFDSESPIEATDRNASYSPPVQQSTVIPVKNTKTETEQPPARTSGKMPPITWSIKVLADNTANGWTNSGWVVRKGQRIRITGEGKVSLGRGNNSTPSGVPSLNDDQKLLKNVATGALIAVIGDDNNDFIYIGSDREFVATRDGALFLGVNEGYLEDNSGAFNVKIEIIPDGNN